MKLRRSSHSCQLYTLKWIMQSMLFLSRASKASRNIFIDPLLKNPHSSNSSRLYHSSFFKNIQMYNHQILPHVFVALSCLDPVRNTYNSLCQLENFWWYYQGRPIDEADSLRSYRDRFGNLALMTTRVQRFSVMCTATCLMHLNVSTLNVVALHSFTVLDFALRTDTFYTDLSFFYQPSVSPYGHGRNTTAANFSNPNMAKDKRRQFEADLHNVVQPCSTKFLTGLRRLAGQSVEVMCDLVSGVCEQSSVRFIDCTVDDWSQRVNISLDMAFYYDYRRLNMFSPVSDHELMTAAVLQLRSYHNKMSKQLLSDVRFELFDQVALNLAVSSDSRHMSGIFCVGSASLPDPDNNQSCILCQAGSYTVSYFSPVRSRDHFRSGAEVMCELCPKNWYSDEDGQAVCSQCPDGTGTQFDGAHQATQCRLLKATSTTGSQKIRGGLVASLTSMLDVSQGSTDSIRSQALVGLLYLTPLLVVLGLAVAHGALVVGGDSMQRLTGLQLELAQVVLMMQRQQRLQRQQQTVVFDEAYMADSYEV